MQTRRWMTVLFTGALGVVALSRGSASRALAAGAPGDAAVPAAAEIPANASVGVVNYDNVLRDLGWKTKFEANLQAAREQLTKDFTAADNRYGQQLTELQKTVAKEGEKLNPQQQQQLGQVAMAVRQTLVQLQQQANEKLAAYRNEWLHRYKDALAPVVRQVAQQRKLTIVLQQNETIVFLEPSVDLTNAVVDAAKAQPPVITDVPMPSLQAPPGITITTQPTTAPTTAPSTAPGDVKPAQP